MSDFDDLTDAVSSAYSLVKFVKELGFNSVLTVIADTHYQNARRIAAGIYDARDKRAVLNRVIDSLELAHTGYHKQWDTFLSQAVGFALPNNYLLFCMRDAYTCCLLGAFYAALDESTLATARMGDARRACVAKDGAKNNIARHLLGHYIPLFRIADLKAAFDKGQVPDIPISYIDSYRRSIDARLAEHISLE